MQGHREAQTVWGSSLQHGGQTWVWISISSTTAHCSASENLLPWKNSSVANIHLNSPRQALKSFSDRQGPLRKKKLKGEGEVPWVGCYVLVSSQGHSSPLNAARPLFVRKETKQALGTTCQELSFLQYMT